MGALSGAVGTYSQLDPEVESYVCDRLGLEIEPAATQVTARDRHAEPPPHRPPICRLASGTKKAPALALPGLLRVNLAL